MQAPAPAPDAALAAAGARTTGLDTPFESVGGAMMVQSVGGGCQRAAELRVCARVLGEGGYSADCIHGVGVSE